jgi:hypothetical protein
MCRDRTLTLKPIEHIDVDSQRHGGFRRNRALDLFGGGFRFAPNRPRCLLRKGNRLNGRYCFLGKKYGFVCFNLGKRYPDMVVRNRSERLTLI